MEARNKKHFGIRNRESRSPDDFTKPPKKLVCRQFDMFKQSEDALLAERLMKLNTSDLLQGRYRTPDQYVNSEYVASMLMEEVGVRAVIEFCVTTLERASDNKKS